MHLNHIEQTAYRKIKPVLKVEGIELLGPLIEFFNRDIGLPFHTIFYSEQTIHHGLLWS
ncbi:MAG: hypothetical protein JSR31_18475 [Nitrospira sp.]|nr:hypothetical protein [Nitrospira sp.]